MGLALAVAQIQQTPYVGLNFADLSSLTFLLLLWLPQDILWI